MTFERLETMVRGCPFHRFLGVVLDAYDAGSGAVTIGLALRPELSRLEDKVELHGGVTAALVDIAGDYAVAVVVGHAVATIDIRIDYLRMGYGERISATARAVRLGRTIGTVDIEVHDARDSLIAVGRGKYTTT